MWKPVNRTRQAGDHPRGEGRRSHGADRPSHVTRQQEQAHHSARYTRLFDLCTLRLYRPCALCHCAVCTDASFVYELKMYFVLREIYLHESSNVLLVQHARFKLDEFRLRHAYRPYILIGIGPTVRASNGSIDLRVRRDRTEIKNGLSTRRRHRGSRPLSGRGIRSTAAPLSTETGQFTTPVSIFDHLRSLGFRSTCE